MPLTAPTGSTITLFTSTSVVPVYGTAEITANVIEEAGTAVQNGTVISFTTSLGVVEPAEARTNNGRVTVRFTAGGQSGTAVISAFSGGANSGGTSSGGSDGGTTTTPGKAATVEIKVGGAAAARLSLTATPSSLPPTGGTVELTATVFDADGNRLPGVPVSFAATAGTLGQPTVTTNGLGEARTTLATTRESKVTASTGGGTGGGNGTSTGLSAEVTVRINAAPTVTIESPTTAIVAGQAASFTITATRGGTTDQPGAAIRNVTVDFGDGDRLSLGPISEQRVSHTYLAGGNYTVTATAEDVEGNRTTVSTVVSVTGAQPLNVAVSVSVPTGGLKVNTPVSISVAVTPTTAFVERYDYDFGDGTTTSLTSDETTHVYSSTGRKTITVTVLTSTGQRGVGRVEVFINSP